MADGTSPDLNGPDKNDSNNGNEHVGIQLGGTVDANGKRVGFFNFPKDPNLRAQWLQKIRRDVGTKFKLTEITKVCSLHFRESEIKKGLGGKKISVDITAVPSKFAWRTSPRKRPPPSARFSRKKGKHRLEESFTLLQAQEETARLDEEVSVLKEKLGNTEAQLRNAQPEIKSQLEENEELKSRMFCINNLSGDESISFYTGFPNLQTFQATLVYLDPGENGQNIRYWRSTDKKVPPTVSRIFVSWINFVYLRFGTINIWPNREEVDKSMPDDFKSKYPKTRVILDCTEIKCQMPSSLLLNSRLFSSYKNHTTLKGLIGIAPSGAITFISELYAGSISDREIAERSGILDLPFNEGDDVMADKGFTVEDLLPLGVSLNIRPFLGQSQQMPAEDVVKTQVIASLRYVPHFLLGFVKGNEETDLFEDCLCLYQFSELQAQR
ncbi:uncharacterized protein [Montipora capricornis]|uniref:uncharacterized protein n=1 Tax=Montipora capricornis TaxID=246305 RepID=UPI0035F21AF7